MRAPLVRITDRIDREPDAGEAQRTPQPREHDDLLGIDVRAGKAQRLDVELMKLAIASFLRTLVTEHRTAGPHALRPLVNEIVLYRGANDPCRRLGRNVRLSPFSLSSNVYISCSTTSVCSPMLRTNNGVASTIGTRRWR